jgi:hypothetical protein
MVKWSFIISSLLDNINKKGKERKEGRKEGKKGRKKKEKKHTTLLCSRSGFVF